MTKTETAVQILKTKAFKTARAPINAEQEKQLQAYRDLVNAKHLTGEENTKLVQLRTEIESWLDGPLVLSTKDGSLSVELTPQEYVAAVFLAFTGSDLGGM